MREIKFRLYVPNEGMFYQTHGDLGAGARSADGEAIVEWSPFVCELPLGTVPDLKNLMQFTGLHDKNGKEIYEGDIVRDTRENNFKSFQIKWSEKRSKFFGQQINIQREMLALSLNGEVIGNIYENPDLLAKE